MAFPDHHVINTIENYTAQVTLLVLYEDKCWEQMIITADVPHRRVDEPGLVLEVQEQDFVNMVIQKNLIDTDGVYRVFVMNIDLNSDDEILE